MGFVVLTHETGLNRNSSIGCSGPVVTTWFLADACSVPLNEPAGSRHCPISVCDFLKATSSTYMPFPMTGNSFGPGWSRGHDQRLRFLPQRTSFSKQPLCSQPLLVAGTWLLICSQSIYGLFSNHTFMSSSGVPWPRPDN